MGDAHPNERYVGDLLQTEYDELLARLVEADSYVSWCRHRHRNDDDIKREMDEFIGFARRHGRRAAEPKEDPDDPR